MSDPDVDREARAAARRLRGMAFERITRLGEEPALYDDATLEERLVAMARLCRAAWLAAGGEIRTVPRSEMPGEIFRSPAGAGRSDGPPRRAP